MYSQGSLPALRVKYSSKVRLEENLSNPKSQLPESEKIMLIKSGVHFIISISNRAKECICCSNIEGVSQPTFVTFIA